MNAIRLAITVSALSLIAGPAALAAAPEPAPAIADRDSQVPANVKVTPLPDWQVGDRYRIERVTEREEVRRGIGAPLRSARSLSEVEVVESNPDGYVLATTLIETNLSNYTTPDRGGAEAAALFAKLFEGRTMEFVTNANGVPVGLRNHEEVIQLMRGAVDDIVAASVEDPQQRREVRATMERMMTGDIIESMAIKDAVIYYGVLGGTYEGGPAQAYDITMPFPFTQAPIAATLYVLLRRIEDGGATLHISTQSVPDPEQLRRVTQDWFRGIVRAQGQSLPPGFQFPEFRMQDTTHYIVDRNRTLPTEVSFERYMRMGDEMLRVDRDVFRLKPAD